MMNDDYKSALSTLETYIVNAKPIEKLLSLFDKIHCLMKLNQVDRALATAIELLSFIESNFSSSELKNSVEKIESNMENLFQNFIYIQNPKFFMFLSKCWIKLVKNFFSQKSLFLKLEKISIQISKKAELLANQAQEKEIEEYYPLMDEIQECMEMTENIDDLKFKFKLIANVLQIYGACCNYASDWSKSIEIHNNAIMLQKCAFAKEANQYQVLGHCYNNVGRAYRNLYGTDKARSSFKKAVEIYKEATDYDSEASRKQDLINAQQNFTLNEKNETTLAIRG